MPTPKLQPAITDRVVKPLDTLGRPPRVEGGQLTPAEERLRIQDKGKLIGPGGKPTELRKETVKPQDEGKKPLNPTGPIKPITPQTEIKKVTPPEVKKTPSPPPPPPKPSEVKKTTQEPKPGPKPANKDKPQDK
jgi:hypothetical protein